MRLLADRLVDPRRDPAMFPAEHNRLSLPKWLNHARRSTDELNLRLLESSKSVL